MDRLTIILLTLVLLSATIGVSTYKVMSTQLATANAQVAEQSATIKSYEQSMAVRDSTMAQFIGELSTINAKRQTATQIVYTYKPEVPTDESRCLDLAPPADLTSRLRANRLQGSPDSTFVGPTKPAPNTL